MHYTEQDNKPCTISLYQDFKIISKKMVRVALIGFGNMGWICLKILRAKQAEVVAVFNRKANVGKDAGQVAGIGNIGQ